MSLAIVNSAAMNVRVHESLSMNIGVHESLSIMVFSEYMPRVGLLSHMAALLLVF